MNGTRTWSIAIATAVAIHVAVFIPDGPPRTAAAAPTSVSVTLAPRPLPEPKPAPAPEPEPEPEPEPAPEAAPEPSTPPPERRRTQRPRQDPEPHERPRDPSTNPEPPAAPRRIDLGAGGNSGVVVRSDRGGTTGVPGGRGGAVKGPASGGGDGDDRDADDGEDDRPAWRPVSELHVRTLPYPKRVPELACDAATRGLEGTVVLGVQVRNDGGIHRVRVIEGIGGGCDEIAARALRRATFDPAVGTHGRPVDFEVRYEYAFERAH